MNIRQFLLAGAAVVLATPAWSAEVAAANTGAAASDGNADRSRVAEVIVTARKRSEKLLDVPVAITALSGAALDTRQISSLSELSLYTPSLTDDSTISGSGRNDRSFPEYVIRGIVPSTTLNPTTTVFIDGAPLASGQVEGLDDLASVEVLKGPQSAYFGRETFAGAINLVTRDPSSTPSARVDALIASSNYYDERLMIEGPILGDALTGRISYRYYSRQGSYDNEAVADKTSEHLGDQSTQSVNIELVAKPTQNLKVKFLGMYWHDSDGPSAQAFIGPDQSNCTTAAEPWFCGTVPARLASQPAVNDIIDPVLQSFLTAAGSPAGMQLVKPPGHYGLERDAYHASLGIDYFIPGLNITISSLSGVDNQVFAELQGLSNVDGSATPNPYLLFGGPYGETYYDDPFLVEEAQRDFSQEFRITSSPDQRFRWLVGVNYAWNRVDSTLAGAGSFSYFVPNTPTSSETYGVFYGLTYDVLKQLSVSFEGRYQSDKQTTVDGISGTFYDFLPRGIIQYKFTPDVMAYVTYSEGVNPGVFNTTSGVSSLTPADQQDFISKYGYNIIVKPEHLDNYEVGFKGRFFGGRATLSADAYYDIWTNQINQAEAVYVESEATKLVSASLNNGKVDVDGIEGDAAWRPIDHVDIDLSGSINNTKIKSGTCVQCDEVTGLPFSTAYAGNQLPNVSKYQASLGVEYSNTLALWSGADWYARFDYSFKSGEFASQDNLVHTPGASYINLRAGINYKALRVEAFVDNLTNNDSATNLALFYNVGNPFETYAGPDALVAGLPPLRTFGLRLKYKL